MKQRIPKTKGGRRVAGPPATDKDPVTAIRLSKKMQKSIDAWATRQTDKPDRSEAIRRLVGLGLEAMPPAPTRAHKETAVKASEMAGSMIDWLSDKSTPLEERAKRKRRLVKGPTEFREMREDLPKPRR